MAKRTFSTLLGCMVAIGLVVGGATAVAGGGGSTPKEPVRRWQEIKFTEDRAQANDLWTRTAAWNAAAYANAANAYGYAAAANAWAVAENAKAVTTTVAPVTKTPQTATQGVSRPSTPKPAPVVSGGGAGGNLAAIRQCESGGNYATNTGNGFFGAYQFTQSTWQSVGGSGNPAAASPAEQDARASALLARSGSSPWPVCGR